MPRVRFPTVVIESEEEFVALDRARRGQRPTPACPLRLLKTGQARSLVVAAPLLGTGVDGQPLAEGRPDRRPRGAAGARPRAAGPRGRRRRPRRTWGRHTARRDRPPNSQRSLRERWRVSTEPGRCLPAAASAPGAPHDRPAPPSEGGSRKAGCVQQTASGRPRRTRAAASRWYRAGPRGRATGVGRDGADRHQTKTGTLQGACAGARSTMVPPCRPTGPRQPPRANRCVPPRRTAPDDRPDGAIGRRLALGDPALGRSRRCSRPCADPDGGRLVRAADSRRFWRRTRTEA